ASRIWPWSSLERRRVSGHGVLRCALEALGQGLAFEELHGQIRDAVRELAIVEDPHDAWVLDHIGCPRLIEESRRELPIDGVFGTKHFEGHAPSEILAHRFPDDTHSPLAKRTDQAIFVNALSLHAWGARRGTRIPS